MADAFDPSPRPSKRRKTYAAGRTTLQPPGDQRILRSVSNALSGISDRIFGRGEIPKAEESHNDSAYGSKEDSLNADEIVVVKDNGATNENDIYNGDTAGGTRNTRRPSRRTARAEDKVDARLPGKDDENVGLSYTKSAETSCAASSTSSPKPMPVKARETRRRSDRKSTQAEEQETPVQDSRSADKQRSLTRNEKTASRQLKKIKKWDTAEKAVTEEAFIESSSRVVHSTEEDVIEVLPESSGQDRKKAKRYSTEQTSVGKHNLADKEIQDGSPKTDLQPTTLAVSPQPKGILTPSRRRREGPRKSVVFGENNTSFEERLGFKDIDLSSKKSRKSPAEQAEIPETPQTEADDEGDIFIDQNPPQDMLHELELPISAALSAKRQPDDSPAIVAIKSMVLSRLTSSSATSTAPAHLSTQYSVLHSLLTSTIAQGESNSLLLLGSRGAGKSLLIDIAMSDLSAKHPSDFHVVRLNGFFQTDDRLALREIWRQLGREREGLGEIDEQETAEVSGSYADTMASLLSLLSHPDDFEGQVEPTAMDVDLPTVKTSKSVVIILDEFDLFTFHPRQTLLYNLFDIAQSKKAPIAVIGCSTRMDVVDCLEKRVKSRFSHRWLHVPSIRSLEGVQEVLERNLCVNQGVTDADGREGEKGRWNHYIKSTFIRSPQVQALVQEVFYTTKSLPDLLAALYIPVATINLTTTETPISRTAGPSRLKAPSKPKSTQPHEDLSLGDVPAIPRTAQPTITDLLTTLPTLHIALLISSARLETIFALSNVNFNAAYQHYTDLIARSKMHGGFSTAASIKQWSKDVCRSVWEDLMFWELVLPVVGGREGVDFEGGGKEEISMRMVRVDVTLEEIAWGVKSRFSAAGGNEEGIGRGVGEVLGRWCREE